MSEEKIGYPNSKEPERPKISRSHDFVANLSLTVCSIAVSLILLEALLHVHNPFQARIKGDHIVLVTNKTYHIRNNFIKSLDPEITVTKNSLGFRGAEPPPAFESYLTLVTVGGSTTHCFFLNEGQTWTAKLAARLEASLEAFWINNAGLDGHTTYGHLVLLQDYIVPLRPKVVLFLVGANDVAATTMSSFDAENVRDGLQFSSTKALIKSLSTYSEVVALFLNMYRSLTAYQAGLMHNQLDLIQEGYVDVPVEKQKQFMATHTGVLLKNYEDRLRRIVEISRRAKIEPVLVTQPFLAGFGTDDVTGVDLARVATVKFGLGVGGPEQNGKLSWNLLEAYNDVTRQVGRENDVLVVDLARELAKTSRYFYDFVHFTPMGAEAIASVINRSLCPMLAAKFPKHVSRPCEW